MEKIRKKTEKRNGLHVKKFFIKISHVEVIETQDALDQCAHVYSKNNVH